MELLLLRFASGSDSTLGLLFQVPEETPRKPTWLCYTLEDEYRTQKVYGETRVPCGRYKLALRTEGGTHSRYAAQFVGMHKGMLWLRAEDGKGEVPGFQWILIHIGNTDDDTAGCLLVGDGQSQNVTRDGEIRASTDAYKRVYPPIAAAVEQGEAWITIQDWA